MFYELAVLWRWGLENPAQRREGAAALARLVGIPLWVLGTYSYRVRAGYVAGRDSAAGGLIEGHVALSWTVLTSGLVWPITRRRRRKRKI